MALIEVLLALSIGVGIAVVMTLVASVGLKNVRSLKRSERLQANAAYLSNSFFYEIKQGSGAYAPSPSTLNVMVPAPGGTKTLTFENIAGRVILDGVPLTTDDVAISSLAFKTFERSVRIEFTARSNKGDESFSATTTVALRNAL